MMSYAYTPPRMTRTYEATNTRPWQAVQQQNTHALLVGVHAVQPLQRRAWQLLIKLDNIYRVTQQPPS